MSLQNYKKSEKGFTIVELLIVIVVIGILAAITIVAFSGIQQRGRDSQRQADTSNIVKALTAYTSDDVSNGGSAGAWPASADLATTPFGAKQVLATYKSANLGSTITGKIGSAAPTSTTNTIYGYTVCSTGSPAANTGATITYWSEAKAAIQTVKAGICP